MLRSTTLLSCAAAIAAESTLTLTVGTQTGFFKTGTDIGSLNPHDYRPNEFVTSDFIFEGLTEWSNDNPLGNDGIADTDDDYVIPSLAASWTSAMRTDGTGKYDVTFSLRTGVTFHDGSAWDAAACKANFDQIMGGYGEAGGIKAMVGMHDWMGFTQSLDGWSVVDPMTFRLTFVAYYADVFRELAFIRPFRMTSVATLPSMADGYLSHIAFKWGAPRMFPWKCWGPEYDLANGGPMRVAGADTSPCYTMNGISAPIGTGPYKVINKKLSTGRIVPAADFNASCYDQDSCSYGAGETVSEVLFQKVEGHRKAPSYDNIVLKSFPSVGAVKDALSDGSLDIAYGVQTLSPSAFLTLATAESGADVVAHKAKKDINTRLIVLNSAGRLDTVDKRKFVMGILAAGRQALYDGELAEEEPMDTLYDPEMPHCAILKTLSSSAALAATANTSVTAASITKPLRFMYKPDIPHEAIIAAKVISDLVTNGINVVPIPVDKAGYNSMNCHYMHPAYYGDDPSHPYYDDDYHAWDIAYSETQGPPYDPMAKLWDMTHGEIGGWCSAEADAPAVSRMDSMDIATFAAKVRGLGNIQDKAARTLAYDEILTTLHDEAIFLPLTAKRQTAVTNVKVAGFKFGFGEFDIPLANLKPAPPKPVSSDDDSDSLSTGAVAGIAVAAAFAVLCSCMVLVMAMKERAGKPVFTSVKPMKPAV